MFILFSKKLLNCSNFSCDNLTTVLIGVSICFTYLQASKIVIGTIYIGNWLVKLHQKKYNQIKLIQLTDKFDIISSYDKLSIVINKIFLFILNSFLFTFKDLLKQDQNLFIIGLEQSSERNILRDISKKLFLYK